MFVVLLISRFYRSCSVFVTEWISTSTAGQGSGASLVPTDGPQQQQWLSPAVEIRSFGEPLAFTVSPQQLWSSEFRNKQPAFIRFNITLPWGANFAVYGRRNVAPSVTQYDFAEFVKGGRVEHRARRSILNHAEHENAVPGSKTYDVGPRSKRSASHDAPTAWPLAVNVTLLQYLDTGRCVFYLPYKVLFHFIEIYHIIKLILLASLCGHTQCCHVRKKILTCPSLFIIISKFSLIQCCDCENLF